MRARKIKDRCLIVAEISANHSQDLKTAVKLIREAKRCGADAVKFQAYTPDSLTIDVDNKYFKIKHPRWAGQTLYKLYKKACAPLVWLRRLKEVSDETGIMFFATAFDKPSVDLLEDLGVPFHKIASFELVDLELISYAAKTKKPVILSTGMADLDEIGEAVDSARGSGAKGVTLLKCVSDYPAKTEEMNLRTMPELGKMFKCQVGFSDHTLGAAVSVAAVALGAKMIEKHFILSRKAKTPDRFFSLEPGEFKRLVGDIRIAESALGEVRYGPTAGEKKCIIFRRSLFAVNDIKNGELFTTGNVRSIRPGYGLKPRYIKNIIGRRASRDIKRGTPIGWNLVKGGR
ncbi:MAG: pseudaminic acid synthase [Candidatus Omnitrophota bacterium]